MMMAEYDGNNNNNNNNGDLEDGALVDSTAAVVNGLRREEASLSSISQQKEEDENDNDNDNDEEHPNTHDQLPTLEEYKTDLAARGESLSPRLSITALNILFDGNKNVEVDDDGEEEEEGRLHDHLPVPEEILTSPHGSSRIQRQKTRKCRNWLAPIAILAGVILIVLAIVVPRDELMAPPHGKFERIVAYLEERGVSSRNDLKTLGTPQYRAAKWLAEEDGSGMTVPEISTSTSTASNNNDIPSRFVERYVMAVFYYATNGPLWHHQLNFLSSRDICEWQKPVITSSGTPLTMGVSKCVTYDVGTGVTVDDVDEDGETNENNNMQDFAKSIYLYSNNLEGSIPKEIGYLERLHKLNLPSNEGIVGELPSTLQRLQHLRDLEFQYCSLTGTIPDWIGEMAALTDLALSNNLLNGRIPTSIAKLSSTLELLTLDNNILEGDVAEFGKLTNLNALYAEDARIYGTITSQMVSNWNEMHDLDLSGNSVGGSLPDNLFEMPDLVVLDLSGNRLTGSLPSLPPAVNNTRLRFLSLFENQLGGSIPSTLANLRRLQHLDLGKNELTSTFPSELGTMTSLRYLHTNSNNFSPQEMPSFLGHLTNLEELSMKDNRLTGSIPTHISSLSGLQLFDLGRNDLAGSIPDEIGHLQNLNFLLLNRNKLTGSLPAGIALMYGLKLVLLEGNQLTGDAGVLCGHFVSTEVSHFAADCLGPDREIDCPCCNICCNDNTQGLCNNFDWSSNLDPLWEYAWERLDHEFNVDPLVGTMEDAGVP